MKIKLLFCIKTRGTHPHQERFIFNFDYATQCHAKNICTIANTSKMAIETQGKQLQQWVLCLNGLSEKFLKRHLEGIHPDQVCRLAVFTVHFSPYLTGLSSMMLI